VSEEAGFLIVLTFDIYSLVKDKNSLLPWKLHV